MSLGPQARDAARATIDRWVRGGYARDEIAGCIDIWQVDLDRVEFAAECGWESLSSDEQARAQAFSREVPRVRFVRARATLRAVLAAYLGGQPSDVRLSYGSYGKPVLAAAQTAAGLEFNLSHSDAQAVIAVTQGRSVGVDLERVEAAVDSDAIVERFFSRVEQRNFAALPVSLRAAAFYRTWTCKEAYLKALGTGIRLPLDEFDVCVDPRRAPCLVKPHPCATEAHALHLLRVPRGFAGAVAISLAPQSSAAWG